MTKKPLAVVISDIHFNINTIALASASMMAAITKANELDVNLIVAGDMHDTKANMRGECVKAILEVITRCHKEPIIIVANHDRLNEKNPEHSLEFLRDKARLITKIQHIPPFGFFIPYYHDPEELRRDLKLISKGSRLIMHQGIAGSNSGEYIQDKSAITPNDVAGLRVISGHYHCRQDIKLPDGGLWSYIGNPYTLNFAEANDPEKGYQILYDDGSLEFVPTNLRKHVAIMIEFRISIMSIKAIDSIMPDDLVKVTVKGNKEFINSMPRETIEALLHLQQSFKLDYVDTSTAPKLEATEGYKTPQVRLDELIVASDFTDDRKERLKTLWRSMCD